MGEFFKSRTAKFVNINVLVSAGKILFPWTRSDLTKTTQSVQNSLILVNLYSLSMKECTMVTIMHLETIVDVFIKDTEFGKQMVFKRKARKLPNGVIYVYTPLVCERVAEAFDVSKEELIQYIEDRLSELFKRQIKVLDEPTETIRLREKKR